MSNFETRVVDIEEIIAQNIKETLSNICMDLEERGYNPVKQIVAYLTSGDPGYISSYKECRERILAFKREDIIEVMLVRYIQ